MPSEAKTAPCVHCGVPVSTIVGGVPVCDECYTVRGACCQEFGDGDLTGSKDESDRAPNGT